MTTQKTGSPWAKLPLSASERGPGGEVPHALLDEYGLNRVSYAALVTLKSYNELQWGHSALKRISGQPAPTLRKLVDRGFLNGPARHQNIAAKPFSLTDHGRDILARIQRGLHRPNWISQGRARALEALAETPLTDRTLLGLSHRMSLLSLRDAGYITKFFDPNSAAEWWQITDLGREAWAEYQKNHPLASAPSPSKGEGRGGGQRGEV